MRCSALPRLAFAANAKKLLGRLRTIRAQRASVMMNLRESLMQLSEEKLAQGVGGGVEGAFPPTVDGSRFVDAAEVRAGMSVVLEMAP